MAILDKQNLATGLPIDVMFGSKVGFWLTLDFFARGLHTVMHLALHQPGFLVNFGLEL